MTESFNISMRILVAYISFPLQVYAQKYMFVVTLKIILCIEGQCHKQILCQVMQETNVISFILLL